MKKVTAMLFAVCLLGTTFAVAAPAPKANKITNTRIVQATKDTTLTYGGVKVFVPAGQTVILGQNSDGSVVVRGQNLEGVKLGEGTITAQGLVVLSVEPKTNVITVNTGSNVLVTDTNGRTAELSQGAAVSGQDIRVSTVPTATVTTVAQAEQSVSAVPVFVAQTETTSAANEQAAQDVEETLSPSSPR